MNLTDSFSALEICTLSKHFTKDQFGDLCQKPFPAFVCDTLESEMKQLLAMNLSSSEAVNTRRYIQYLIALPWLKHEFSRVSIEKTRRLLDENHYGLESVKQEILEYLAVRNRTGLGKSKVLLLSGPPGVGKTSIAKSIARALDYPFYTINLGGIKDELKIRGCSRAFINSRPGSLIEAFVKTKSLESVILLDEIDKSEGGLKGNLVEDALLEILDSDNSKFVDLFIDLPMDLSSTLFVATCNAPEKVSKPLMDRMHHIPISGYSTGEKFTIIHEFLIPRILEQHGISQQDIELSDDAVWMMIRSCPSPGIRDIEKSLAKICQYIAYRKECCKQAYVSIDKETYRKIMTPSAKEPEVYWTKSSKPHPVFEIRWGQTNIDMGTCIARYASEVCPDFKLVKVNGSSYVITLQNGQDEERIDEMCWLITEQLTKAGLISEKQADNLYQIIILEPLTKAEFNACESSSALINLGKKFTRFSGLKGQKKGVFWKQLDEYNQLLDRTPNDTRCFPCSGIVVAGQDKLYAEFLLSRIKSKLMLVYPRKIKGTSRMDYRTYQPDCFAPGRIIQLSGFDALSERSSGGISLESASLDLIRWKDEAIFLFSCNETQLPVVERLMGNVGIAPDILRIPDFRSHNEITEIMLKELGQSVVRCDEEHIRKYVESVYESICASGLQASAAARYTASGIIKETIRNRDMSSNKITVSAYMLKTAEKTKQKTAEQMLNGMVSIEGLKSAIHGILQYYRIKEERKKANLPVALLPMHMQFTGNPGTGKTTAARVVSRLLYEQGVLISNKFLEVSREDLVGRYIGETEAKTLAVINSALDGVLFIDEAYSLFSDSERDFGNQVVSTLVKKMEDERERLVVILAGYPGLMENLNIMNPGLAERIPYKIHFPDYSPSELLEILKCLCNEEGYMLSAEANVDMELLLEKISQSKDERFGNGRLVRNLLDRLKCLQAERICRISALKPMDLMPIQREETSILLTEWQAAKKREKPTIGFAATQYIKNK